ncbi:MULTISPECIES: hypothetical protein [Nostocales]|uniref:Uncharacterized protein n=3 Tax=Nostocales TaxID=1161 RepID=A0A8S9T4S2_9CYAN|nr:hypothetical protein [Tolypothrix bouteillei]KAF3886529.1 hypothetical protein DA73_0400014345 [Tolypothrix bouteillei VB521301]
MTSSDELSDTHIEIASSSLRILSGMVYSIPKKQLGVYTPIKLRVNIVHKTSNSLYLNPEQPLIPELLTSDGQIIQGRLVTEELITNTQPNNLTEGDQTKKLENCKIRVEGRRSFYLTARLFWRDSSLQLAIPSSPNSGLINSVDSNYFWCFDRLEAKIYQLRFVLNTARETTPVLESKIEQEETVWGDCSEILSTPWLNLHLVQPLVTDEHTIEVDGVTFKIEMPNSIFRISKSETRVKLGIHITNNTSMTLRFYQKASIEAILIGDDGKEINSQSDPPGRGRSKEPEYYSVKPGKSVFLNLESMLLWSYKEDPSTNIQETWYFDKSLTLRRRSSEHQHGFQLKPKVQIQLAVPNKTRHRFNEGNGFDYFSDLKVGASYQLQVIYCVSDGARNLESRVLEKIWTGWIAMPFVEFHLVKL